MLCTPRQVLLAKYQTRLERTSDQINHPRPIFRITIDCHDVRGDLNTWHNDHVKTGSVHHLRVEHPCLGLRRNYCCRSWAPTAGERGGRRRPPATLGVSAGRNLRWDFWELFSMALFDKILFKVIRQAALRKFTSRNGVRKKWWVCHKWKLAHTLSSKTCRFVLFGPTTTEPARLEYWDNERKWRAKTPPKRSIVLQKCFNINRKLDTRSSWRSKEIALVWIQLFLICCFFQGFSKQDCHCYLHLGRLHVSCLRDRERAQRLARPAAHSAARQERQRGREATGAELRAHVERHGQGVHSWREQLHPGGPPERPATSLRDPKLCEVLPGRLRPLCRVPPRVFALLCPQWPALQTRDRSQFSLRLWSAPHRLWPSWGVSVPPPDDGQGDGELEEQGALPEILWFPKSLLIAERGATSRRKSNAAPEERSAKHGTQPDDLGTSVGGRRQAWSGDSWARDEATKTALREVISR